MLPGLLDFKVPQPFPFSIPQKIILAFIHFVMLHNLKKSRRENILLYICGTFFFILFALYNSYPIVNIDTGTYLDSGFQLTVPDERPVFYGLFIRASSLGMSLWLTVAAQSLILCYVLTQFIRGLLPKAGPLHIAGLLLLISLGTILSWYSSQVMPDIFTPILFLSVATYLLFPGSRARTILLLCIFYLAIVTHFSHYMISTLFAALLITGSFLYPRLRVLRGKALILLAISLFAWLSLFISNFIGGKGFVSSNVSHVFLMGKLTESGVLKTYLDKACPTRDYKICAYKDSLPYVAWEFVWDQQHSPVFKTGGWGANKAEYTTIIHDIASRPKYWPYLAFKSAEATARQVILTNIDEGEERSWVKFEREHPLYQNIEQKFPHEISEFAVSKQNIKILNLVFYDEVYIVVLILSSLLCMFFLRGALLDDAKTIYFLVGAFLLLNAFATATFGNVLSRLNSRAVWLLPMVNILFIYKIIEQYYSERSPERLS